PVLVTARVLVPVVGTVDGASPAEVKILALDSSRSGEKECRTRMLVQNDGDVAVRPSLGWGFARASRKDSDELELNERGTFLLLPGHRRVLRGSFDCTAADESDA